MKIAHRKVSCATTTEIPFQAASLDIWDKKYRLKNKSGEPIDRTIDETYKRVARALAEVETTKEKQEEWYEHFLWALRRGAIPAGRVTSNAGALEYKPATSTINCTVSGTIRDSMDDILGKVHEAGLTLKAGCVAPGTLVRTEKGLVTADRAVVEQHEQILCYDRDAGRFEMRRIERHLTTHVARADNIEINSNGVSLKTSIKHPVLVYRDDHLQYVRADDVRHDDALVHYQLPWAADTARWMDAWFAGAHLGDGSAYEKQHAYQPTRQAWAQRAKAHGRRLVFKIRAAERQVVERYAAFFASFSNARAMVVATATPNGTPVWDYTVASFESSRAATLIDEQIGKKTDRLHVPAWITQQPEKYFLPFLAGLIDTDGTVSTECGSASVASSNQAFLEEIKSLLGLFGVNAGITVRKPREHVYNGNIIRDHDDGAMLKISDSAFLQQVAEFMADDGKRERIRCYASQAGQYDKYVMTTALRAALQSECADLAHHERQTLGFYHNYHQARVISRTWLDRWEQRFPQLSALIAKVRTLRPVDTIRRNLALSETFYDFTVEKHNNYLAGNHGLMVIHNCGIGYEFSTLRPKGAYVSGAGAYTSGPLSFMDIYDKMCFTVSSAGGRRGAQMATFDVGHPDAFDFVRVKREDGRLRQFNLSLLITEGFMEAVKSDSQWKLAFPVTVKEADTLDLQDPEQVIWREWPTTAGYISNDQGLVACKVYKTVKARRLWDAIMSSTYDYAEPGFILIDKVNEMNNNWFCETIRATNPCVSADTWVHTADGPQQVKDLLGKPFLARVNGKHYATTNEGFFKTATKEVLCLETVEGHKIKLTADHLILRAASKTRHLISQEWCEAGQLQPGDYVVLHNHRQNTAWDGAYNYDQGYLLGHLIGDGTLKSDKAVLSVWQPKQVVNATAGIAWQDDPVMAKIEAAARTLSHRSDFSGWSAIKDRGEFRLSTAAITQLARALDMTSAKEITPAMEKTSSEFHRGLLCGLFDTDGSIQGDQEKGVSVRLAQSDLPRLEAVQRMLLRLGIASTIYQNRRVAQTRKLPDGKGGYAEYQTKAQHELIISGDNLHCFAEQIGFSDSEKSTALKGALANYQRQPNRERFLARVQRLTAQGSEDVFDVQVPGINAFDANGFYTHNCGEQPLPPYGSCLLGSINLTKFVRNAFTENASFDWEEFRQVVAVFTRMLDNVVEINGLPLAQQSHEILRKRRHGMGYLGLGSTMTMLRMKYGAKESLQFTERVTQELAVVGWQVALELAKEKGPAPIMEELFTVTEEMLRKRPEMTADGWQIGDQIPGKILHAKYSRYMQRVAQVAPEVVAELAQIGARYTHHSSIAPTGTISLSLANNASNGIEPSFAHHYFRNVIREGKKSKEKVDVYSFELLAYRQLINPKAMPFSNKEDEKLPDYFIAADDISPKEHVDVQAAAQKWIDSSISKTANVPTDYPYEDFKDIYLYAYEQGLKGCTTFRFNPAAFQGVLVKEQDLANTTYRFVLEDGSVIEVKGNEEIEYDGEKHTAANLYDALKEGYYGKF